MVVSCLWPKLIAMCKSAEQPSPARAKARMPDNERVFGTQALSMKRRRHQERQGADNQSLGKPLFDDSKSILRQNVSFKRSWSQGLPGSASASSSRTSSASHRVKCRHQQKFVATRLRNLRAGARSPSGTSRSSALRCLADLLVIGNRHARARVPLAGGGANPALWPGAVSQKKLDDINASPPENRVTRPTQ